MSAASLYSPGDPQEQLRGWGLSLLIHGCAVALSLALVTSLRLPPEGQVFTWDVALVEPFPAASIGPAEQHLPEMEPPQPLPPVAPTVTKAVKAFSKQRSLAPNMQPLPVQHQSAVEAIPHADRISTPRTDARQEPVRQIVHERVNRTVVTTESAATPVPSAMPTTIIRSSMQTTVIDQVIDHSPHARVPVQTSDRVAVLHEVPLATETTISKAAPVSQRIRTAFDSPVVTSSPDVRDRPESSEPARVASIPVIRHDTKVETPAMAPVSLPQNSERQATAPVSSLDSGMVTERKPQTIAAKPLKKAIPSEIAIRSTGPDYGWLAIALRKSMEKHQAATDTGGTIRLMLRIRQEGRQIDLVDLAVAESSGHLTVDRKALEIVRRTFPMEFTGTLERQEVSLDMDFTMMHSMQQPKNK